jgi:hypothetical protein
MNALHPHPLTPKLPRSDRPVSAPWNRPVASSIPDHRGLTLRGLNGSRCAGQSSVFVFANDRLFIRQLRIWTSFPSRFSYSLLSVY